MKRILEVQKQMGTLSKDAKNPFFKSKYLDLTTLIEHVTPLLNAQGLVLIQPIEDGVVSSVIVDSENGKPLCHSGISLPNESNPQKLGSAISYYRRYTLKSLLAIAEDDDDGNKASKPTPPIKQKLTPEQYTATLGAKKEKIIAVIKKFDLTVEQSKELNELIK